MTALNDGGYVVAWAGFVSSANQEDIFVQRFDKNNNPVGAMKQLQGADNSDQAPQVTATTDGGYVVVWEATSDAVTNDNIYIQKFGSDNNPVGGMRKIFKQDIAGYNDTMPQVTATKGGGYVVTWMGLASGTNTNIYVEAFDGDGVPAGTAAGATGTFNITSSLSNLPVNETVNSYVATYTGGTLTVGGTAYASGATIPKATWDAAVAANTVLFSNASATNYSFTLVANVTDSTTGLNFQVTVNKMGTGLVSPLVVDLNGDGVQTLGLEQGVVFDLAGSGTPVKTGWVSAQDGLLAIDLNQDGVINSGAELLGSGTTLANGSKAADGWAALATLDSNADGVIDLRDARFADLRVWRDADSDGVTDAGELLTLPDAGIASLAVTPDASTTAQNGNLLMGTASVTHTDGRTTAMTDAWFATAPVPMIDLDAVAKDGVVDLSNGKTEVLKLSLSDLMTMDRFLPRDDTTSVIDMNRFVPRDDDGNIGDDTSVVIASEAKQSILITGDATDVIKLEGLWSPQGTTSHNGQTFNVYQHSGDQTLQVLIDQQILQSHVQLS